MSELYCANCEKLHESESRFCEYCGFDLKEAILRFKQKRIPVKYNESLSSQEEGENKQVTFFCPKCKHENNRENLFCVSCHEDFSKYNISGTVKDAIRRTRAQKDEASMILDFL
ncbi:MAG: hypothetical protein HGN29_09330 [Asgard group archaeon]|nr:hypothetical protein [Asgard group archaeon]